MQTAEVVIIGGGVMGTSLAYHLAKRGVKDVVLLEKRFLAAGGTGKSTALVRQHYDNYPESRMVYESWKYFIDWAERVGGDCGFVKSGFIRTVIPEETEMLKANVKMHQAIGIHTQLISAGELHELEPHWDISDIRYAAYEPDSGFADPQATTLGLADAAKRYGARILQDRRATAIRVSDSKVTGVLTDQEEISAPVVVIAAGPWSVPLCKSLGIDLPIACERHQLATFHRPPELVGPMRCVVDGSMEMYFKPEGRELTIVGAGIGVKNVDPDHYNEGADEDNIQYAAERISKRIPRMEQGLSQGGWAGFYDMTPDEKMIVDKLPYEGLFLNAGHSGTGFKMGPAVGLLLSEWICDGHPTTMDISPFRLSRFAEGKPLFGEHPYSTSWHTGRKDAHTPTHSEEA
ncbi:MAG: FAD-dependent oxidoreductase [Anaerolineae bacterium]